jgi:hypothetical protein
MALKTIADWWADFESNVLPKGAGPIQHQEMRRAFYAGFHAALLAGFEMADASGDNDDLGATMMDRMYREAIAFSKSVTEGKA